MSQATIMQGDCLERLRELPDSHVHTCVTSPPYFGLRDYGVDGQIGLEPTPDEFVAKLVEVFREVSRVLRDDGTLWLNLGDSYATGTKAPRNPTTITGPDVPASWAGRCQPERVGTPAGYKTKDLLGIPWRVAFALQADGWYLRSDIVWHKPNPMPESVTDRPTKAHEYLFLFAKSDRYYFDAEAFKEPAARAGAKAGGKKYSSAESASALGRHHTAATLSGVVAETRNRRSVWTVAAKPFSGAHFATFPPALVEPCILAGAPAEGVVLDPFTGSGTTGMVARKMGRKFVGIELNPDYAEMARRRIASGR